MEWVTNLPPPRETWGKADAQPLKPVATRMYPRLSTKITARASARLRSRSAMLQDVKRVKSKVAAEQRACISQQGSDISLHTPSPFNSYLHLVICHFRQWFL